MEQFKQKEGEVKHIMSEWLKVHSKELEEVLIKNMKQLEP